MFLRALLLVFCIQKALDFLGGAIFTPVAADLFGIPNIQSNPLAVFALRLWGAASLAWAYFLLRAFINPRQNLAVVEGTVLGFIAVGLVGLLSAVPVAGSREVYWLTKGGGVFLILEAVVLTIAWWKSGKK